jgi:osmoprotectant transport system permease protein
MQRRDMPAAGVVLNEMTEWLRGERGIICLGPLGFENAYALALPRETAARLGIGTIADLAAHAPELTMGGDYEFFGRPEWAALRDEYGLRFRDEVAMDSTLMYAAARAGEVDVIAAFSTDGRLAAYDLTVLDDPRGALPPYDAVLLLGRDVADDVRAALSPLIGAIDDNAMRQANRLVDVDGRPVSEAARYLLRIVEGAP